MTTALANLKLHSSGKVREIYELDGDLLMVASDRISVYDVILPDGDPRQGQCADPDVPLLVRADRRHRPEPLHLRGRAARGRGPRACGSGSSRCTRSSAWSAATSRVRAGGSTRRPARSAGSRCRTAAGVREAARADLHPGDQGRAGGARREHRLRPSRRDHRRPAADGGAAPDLDRALPARPPTTRPSAASSSPTPSSSSAARRAPNRPRRRSPDPRLVAVLALRRVRAGPRPGLVRQAVRPRLARSAGTTPAPPSCRRKWSRTPAPSTSRPTSGSPAAAWTAATADLVKAKVLIRPKEGILDPRARRSSGRCRRSASTASTTFGWAGWSSSRPTIRIRSRPSARSCSPTR